MLRLTRRAGESIAIGEDITITVLAVGGGQVHLGFDAPPAVKIWRTEIAERIRAEREAADE